MPQIRQAVVLAGGRGTRLGELTSTMPKPLLDVGGRPFLDWVLANLERQGVEEVILTTGYRADEFDRWASGYDGTARVSTFVEQEPLDTGGALTRMTDRLSDAFYVLNGDTLFDAPLAELATGLLEAPDSELAMALRGVDDVGRYGRVMMDDGRVASFSEKRASGPGLINGGVYALRRSALAGREAPLSIERTLIPELVRAGRVTGLSCGGFFIDIGLPETLFMAQTAVPRWWAEVSAPDESEPSEC